MIYIIIFRNFAKKIRMTKKIGRNDKCSCDSGLKYKKCCLGNKVALAPIVLSQEDESKTFQYIDTHESTHILNILIGLQLAPENHGKNVRIEELANYLVQNLNSGQQANLQTLRLYLDKEYADNYMEDPPTNLFCENVVFHGGNYTVFPGIMNSAVETFNTLLSAIFQCENKLPDPFKNRVYHGITFMLRFGQLLADKVGIAGNIAGIDDEFRSTLKIKYEGVNFGITQEEIFKICEGGHEEQKIDSTIVNDFVCIQRSFDNEDLDSSPLLYFPIVQFNDKYYFLMLSNQVHAMSEYILRVSKQYNCNTELVRLYHEKIWSDLVQVCLRMNWKRIDIDLPRNTISPNNTKELVFQFDTNRIAYLCFWHNTETKSTLNHNHSIENPSARTREVINHLKGMSEFQDSRLLTLITYDCVGRQQLFGFEEPQEKELLLALSANHFIQLASTEKWNRLSLWKFAKSYEQFQQSTMTTPFSDTLDMYSVYKAQDESFYLSDDAKSNLLFVVPGDGSRLIKESKIKRNLHGAIVNIDNRQAYIPIIKSADYAPLYEPQHFVPYYALCLEVFKFPVWITNKQIKDEQMFIQIQNYAKAIGFWLYKLQNEIVGDINAHINFPLEIELFLDHDIFKNITAREIQDANTKICPYSFDYSDDKIRFYIHISSLPTLSGGDNEGERKMMTELVKSFNQIEGINFSSEFVSRAIDNAIPLGNAKMMLMYDTQKDLQTDPRWLVEPLFISKSEVNMLLDELPLLIEKERTIPKKIKSAEEKRDFFNFTTGVLLKKLEKEIQIFNYEDLLDTLIRIHERLVWEREHNRIIIPAQLLCFGDIENKVEEIQIDEGNLVKTTLALRCLIEYLAALPTQGAVRAGYDDIDRLLVLMNEIIYYGFLSDSIHLKMQNPEVGKLESGRIGISKEFFDDKMKPFAEACTKESIDNYIQHFDGRFEISELPNEPEVDATKDGYKRIDDAFLKDWGISYTNTIDFCVFAAFLCIKSESSVITMKEKDFIETLKLTESNLQEQEITAGLKHFSLESRLNYLTAPNGFCDNEVFPWRYNREFSFARRFIVKYKNNDGDLLLKWGFRNAIAAQHQLSSLLFKGKLNNGGKEIEKLLGQFRRKKGKLCRDEIKDWFKTSSELIVFDHEIKIAPDGHLKADKNYGDIDILVYNKNTKTVLSLECKNTNKAKNMHEMKKEMDNYLGREGQKGMVQKHLDRHNWLNQHVQKVCAFLNIEEIVQIKSYILTSEVIPTTYIRSQDLFLPIISFSELKREGLRVFD